MARRYSSEFRERAVRLVIESGRPITHVARELGVNERTLNGWVHRASVPAEIRAAFEAALGEPLPDPLPLGRRVNVFYEVAECLAEERTARGICQVRAGHDGTYFLDCYREIQSPMPLSSLTRMRADGSTEALDPEPGVSWG